MNMARPTFSKLGTIQTYMKCRSLHQIPRTPTAQAGVQHNFIHKGDRNLPALNTVVNNRLSAERLRMMPFNRNVNATDYYELLGIQANAKAADIKTAYYALAKQFHPDSKLTGDSAARRKFVELSTAYEVLSDATKRTEYDRTALAKLKHGLMGRNVDRRDTFSAAKETTRVVSTAGYDFLLELPFLDAITGTERTVTVSRSSPCSSCRTATGTAKKVHQSVLCPLCKGTGRSVKLSGSVNCKMCLGARYTVKSVCQECGDRCTIVTDDAVTVAVPAGTDNSDVLTVKHPHTGRPLRVCVRIAESDQFRRQGHDVYTTVSVPLTLAILGGDLAVPGLYGGEVHTKLPAGTQPQTQIRLVGKGIRKNSQSGHQQSTGASSGDQILVVNIRIPQQLSERQRALLTSFAAMESVEPQPNSAMTSGTTTGLSSHAQRQQAKQKNWSRIAQKISSSAVSLLTGA